MLLLLLLCCCFFFFFCVCVFFFQAEDGIRDLVRSRGLGDVYKRQLMYLWLQLEVEVSFNGPVEFTDTRILCPEDAHQTKKLHQLSIMTGYHAFILLTRSVCNGAAAEAVVAREATDLTVFPSIPLGSGYLTIPVLATFPRSTSIPVSYTHLRAHETVLDLVCRLLLEKKNTLINLHNLFLYPRQSHCHT